MLQVRTILNRQGHADLKRREFRHLDPGLVLALMTEEGTTTVRYQYWYCNGEPVSRSSKSKGIETCTNPTEGSLPGFGGRNSVKVEE